MRTELDYQSFEQPVVRNIDELGFEILKNRVNNASWRHTPKRRTTMNNPLWTNNDVKQALEVGREPRRINNRENIETRSQLKRIVKQEKHNKELNIAIICKHNRKSFYSYINERRIVRDT